MKISFHYTYLIVALGFILAGYFSNLLVFTSIIIIHELGHYLVAKYYHLDVIKITIYPNGGLIKMNNPINTKISIELQVALAGILFQSVYYFLIIFLYQNNIIREYIFNEFTNYNRNIFFFNLLPIHPLDGSKILSLLLFKYLPYKLTLKLNIIISLITISILLIVNYYKFNYTSILIFTVILSNIVKYHREIEYYFNHFLLERYLYNIRYNKNKVISRISNMCKEKYHIIKDNNRYMTENQFLRTKFSRKM